LHELVVELAHREPVAGIQVFGDDRIDLLDELNAVGFEIVVLVFFVCSWLCSPVTGYAPKRPALRIPTDRVENGNCIRLNTVALRYGRRIERRERSEVDERFSNHDGGK
jgi:hypothetical protein